MRSLQTVAAAQRAHSTFLPSKIMDAKFVMTFLVLLSPPYLLRNRGGCRSGKLEIRESPSSVLATKSSNYITMAMICLLNQIPFEHETESARCENFSPDARYLRTDSVSQVNRSLAKLRSSSRSIILLTTYVRDASHSW